RSAQEESCVTRGHSCAQSAELPRVATWGSGARRQTAGPPRGWPGRPGECGEAALRQPVRGRRKGSVEVEEALQDLHGVLVDLVGAVLGGTDLVLEAGDGVLADLAVLAGVGPALEREGGLLVHLTGLLHAQPVLEGADRL